MKIRKEGYPFIGAGTALFLASFLVGLWWIRLFTAALALFVAWFFRDPERETPADQGIVVSPADGEVIDVCEETDPVIGACTKVAVFMSVFNVHVNRAPVSGRVRDVQYRPGTFHVASLGKKTESNERMIIYLDTPGGVFRVDQVAGIVARRIVCWLKPGDEVEAGQRIGLIRFGSLLECRMPNGFVPVCERTHKVRAGRTVIARRVQ